jgi:hypothetical protein
MFGFGVEIQISSRGSHCRTNSVFDCVGLRGERVNLYLFALANG